MRIAVISPDYPDSKRAVFPFVKQLVDQWALLGEEVYVIAPYSVTHNKGLSCGQSTYNVGNNEVHVIRPNYFSVSNIKIGGSSLSDILIKRAINKGLKSLPFKPDIIYGHFWFSAFCGYDYARNNSIPLFVASGESEIDFRCDNKFKINFCEYVSGVICVSTKNKVESVSLGLTTENKCIVIPNAINPVLFHKRDRIACRKELELPSDVFIMSFVGWFSSRKGSKRVSQAIDMIKDCGPVYSIFIGEGDEAPDCSNILFKGSLPHSLIPSYLNASDAFVLPTLHEGCCNSIIEAMACGLPVISSDLPFNKDICNKENSILIDPMNIGAIKDAIIRLRDDINYRMQLSKGALTTTENLSIAKRAERIIDFFNSRI